MPELSLDFSSVTKFAAAMKLAAPEHLLRATGKALGQIGKADTEKMRERVSGSFNIKAKSFPKSFKYRASDSRDVASMADLELSEYTGAKPFRIFQTGGAIVPRQSRTLTIIAPGARRASGRRNLTTGQLHLMIAAGEAQIIQTRSGAMIIKKDVRLDRRGEMRRGSKMIVLAFLRKRVTEPKRIDFFANFEAQGPAHEAILAAAGEEALQRTIAEEAAS